MAAQLPWAVFVSLSIAHSASVPAKEAVAFDSKLLSHALEAQVREEPWILAASQGSQGSPESTAGSSGAAVAFKDAQDDFLSALPGAAFPDPPDADDGSDSFAVRNRFGYKKFLLAVFFLGGWIRFLTSAWYLKFLSEVFDPVEW